MIENQIKKYPYLGIELIQNFIIIGLKQLGNNFFAKVSIDLYNHIQYVTVSLDVMYQKHLTRPAELSLVFQGPFCRELIVCENSFW